MFWQNLHVYQLIFGIKIRASLKSLLYRKTLKLTPSSLTETSVGNLVTIITRDINEIEHNLWMAKDFLVFTVQTFTVAYLLWAKIGHCAFIGLGTMFLAIPLQCKSIVIYVYKEDKKHSLFKYYTIFFSKFHLIKSTMCVTSDKSMLYFELNILFMIEQIISYQVSHQRFT